MTPEQAAMVINTTKDVCEFLRDRPQNESFAAIGFWIGMIVDLHPDLDLTDQAEFMKKQIVAMSAAIKTVC